ncbi:MAG: hypothetical protein HKO79_12470 [Desulfobacterales bacterium]|nr:hypothetical protein [Desulfobacterales bacterium]
MASGKRLPGESFEDYRARLKDEQKELKRVQHGKLIHVSAIITERADKESLKIPKSLRELVKVAVLGTFRKRGKNG